MKSSYSNVIPVLSVVIPCYRQFDELQECLASVLRQDTDLVYEVIVVNSEPNQNVEDIVRKSGDVRIITGGKRLYPASARNVGARYSHADVIVFFDADVVVDPDWLDLAYKKLIEGYNCIGGAVKNRYLLHPVEFTDNMLQFADFSPQRKSEETDVIPVCNFVIKKSVFNEINGFSENTLLSGEDVQFCKKLSERYPSKIMFYNSLVVMHRGRSNLQAFLDHQYQFGFTRGYLGLSLKYSYRMLGSKFIMLGPVVIKRLVYIINANLRWKPVNIFFLILFFPLLLSGLISWAWGFYRGCATEN